MPLHFITLFAVASTPLQIASLLEELLVDISHCYFQLGLLLGLPHGKVRQISVNHPSNVQQCLTEVLIERLNDLPPLTWPAVARALDSCGQRIVADRIRTKHCGVSSSGPSSPRVSNLAELHFFSS